jgi:hypothetical protein
MTRLAILLFAVVCSGCCSCRDAAPLPIVHVQGEIGHPQFAWFQIQRQGAWIKEGAMISFYEDGRVESIQTIVDNELNGPAWDYFADGRPSAAGSNMHGKPKGVWRIWAADGTFHDHDLGK